MKNKKLIVYGHGKFAEYVRYAFTLDSEYDVIGFCLESTYLANFNLEEGKSEIFNFDNLEDNYNPNDYDLFIAVGNDKIRERLFLSGINKGYFMANYISKNTILWENLSLGQNVFISEDSAIQPFVKIGNNTIIIGAKIGHHSIIGANSLLSTCVIGANVKIGNNCFLGINSSVKSNVEIKDRNIIGMGSIITKNTGELEVYTTPAAIKRKLNYSDISERYL